MNTYYVDYQASASIKANSKEEAEKIFWDKLHDLRKNRLFDYCEIDFIEKEEPIDKTLNAKEFCRKKEEEHQEWKKKKLNSAIQKFKS